ncbi:MAG: hypothetical protein LIO49_09395 [Ruminococcus sp.]|nr:hypothetical protein [Ruminococcus sp.]
MDSAKLVAEHGKLTLVEFDMPEPEFTKTNKSPFGSLGGHEVPVETDGENPQHVGVLNAWGGSILRGTPLVADGREGINGLTLSNAITCRRLPAQKSIFCLMMNSIITNL